MVFESIFNAITAGLNAMLSPLLKLPSFWVVLIISLIASFIASVIYKYTTDQKLMKRLKEEQKELQTQARKEKGPKATHLVAPPEAKLNRGRNTNPKIIKLRRKRGKIIFSFFP